MIIEQISNFTFIYEWVPFKIFLQIPLIIITMGKIVTILFIWLK